MTVTILTVDDSRTMRDMLRMALVDAGFRVVQAEDGLHGLDVLRAAAVTPGLVGQGAHGFDGQAAYLSQAAMTALSAKAGSPVTVTAAGHSAVFTVAGSLPGAGEDQAIVVIDIADAQWRFGSLGRLQRVDLKFGADTSTQAVQAAIARALPPDAQIVTQRQESHRSDALSRAYRVNLEMLAMVALMTGGFLVYSGQSLSVARRRPQFALLRVLGLSQRHLILQIVIEGAAVGLAGGLIGVAAGTGFATLALALFGGDLGGGYFQGARPHLAFAPGAGLVDACVVDRHASSPQDTHGRLQLRHFLARRLAPHRALGDLATLGF